MAQSPSGSQLHADDGDGDALRLSPQAAQQDRSHSCTTCQRLRIIGDIYPRRCFECTTEYDSDGQVLLDRQKRLHTITVGATSRLGAGPPPVLLRVVMAIVWLIRSSPAQFRGSGTFDTPYFWYAPEDVSRAYWYLNHLRRNPRERQREGTKSSQLARPMRTGADAGLSSLHNSVSEGE